MRIAKVVSSILADLGFMNNANGKTICVIARIVLFSRLTTCQCFTTGLRQMGLIEGLSRMKGNFHVRVSGGLGLATAPGYPVEKPEMIV